MESEYTDSVYKEYKKNFGADWIDKLGWKDNTTRESSLQEGIQKMNSFLEFMVTQYSKLILSGDQFVNDTNYLGKISEELIVDIMPTGNAAKKKLINYFSNFQEDVREAESLVKYHCQITREQFSVRKEYLYTEAIHYECNRPGRSNLIDILEVICDVCWAEYKFSFNDNYVNGLLLLRGEIIRIRKNYTALVGEIALASLSKIELLLAKLSFYYRHQQIQSNFDFTLETFSLVNVSNYPQDDFRRLFIEYINPKVIDDATICEWQIESNKIDVNMWQVAMLMRYYTKVTKSREQINNLLKIEEHHYKDYLEHPDNNIVNEYANKSFRNFIYNSRFSFLCQSEKVFSETDYNEMKHDLEKIESIQNETFIFNYHPYERALEFAIRYLDKQIREVEETDTLKDTMSFINEVYEKFKKNLEWCKRNQPFHMQLRYIFSSIKPNKEMSFNVFCPSSFCRPLRYSILAEHLARYNNKIALLEYQVEHMDDKRILIEAKGEIESIKQKNIKYMGLYASVMTFFVGLLSIFIGNNGSVSIFTKMQYVVALGLILLMFMCAGYFALGNRYDKYKPFIFGIILLFSIIAIIILILHF